MSASTSPEDLALEALRCCLEGAAPPPQLIEQLATLALHDVSAEQATRALFGILVERLGDLFEPGLCLAYADLFSQVIALAVPELTASLLAERYRRIRQPRRYESSSRVRDVYVLSRVTLGADVAVTSVILAAAKQRFPEANIHLVGPAKNHALFAADPRVLHAAMPYGRSATLAGRLCIWQDLKTLLTRSEAIVIDPDSRLTQLGLLPVCAEEQYYFFESRSYQSETGLPLATLAADWAGATFGVENCRPYLAPQRGDSMFCPEITVSLGFGGNEAKAVSQNLERRLLRRVSQEGRICLDRGLGQEERQRTASAADALANVQFYEGEFAPFAALIGASKLYFGYDSAGQHVAAASGAPRLVLFKGFVSERMFQRWQPVGPGWQRIIRVEEETEANLEALVESALDEWKKAGSESRTGAGIAPPPQLF